MVKRLLAFACMAVALSIAAAPLAYAQGNGQAGGNGGNGNSEQAGGGGNAGGSNANAGGQDGNTGNPGGNSSASKAHKADEDVALEAVQSDDALPLMDILRSVRHSTKDKIIDAQLFSLADDLVYEVKVMAPDGHVSRLYYHAKSGRRLSLN